MIYVLCIAVILAAIPLAWWIKREGERSWARHQEMVRRAQIETAFVRLSITIRDEMTPKLAAMGEALAGLSKSLRRVGDSLADGSEEQS